MSFWSRVLSSLLFIIGLNLWNCHCFAAIQERAQPVNLTTSIVVPCHYTHFEHVRELLFHYCNQTVLPDEIVISLSSSIFVHPLMIEELEAINWPFQLKIVKSSNRLSAGENRNVACHQTVSDLIITQDADDLPHPQRVELIKYIFENFEIDHLMHYYRYLRETQNVAELLQYHGFEELDDLLIHADTYEKALKVGGGTYGDVALTNGNIAFLRHVFNKVEWPKDFLRAEDTQFNEKVYKLFENTAIIRIPLLYYRQYLSTDR